MLAAGLIRDNLQAHLAPGRVGEQPPSSTPTSLPVRTIFDSDVERWNETPAFSGEGQPGSAGACSARAKARCRMRRKGGVSRDPRRAAAKPAAFRPDQQ